MENFFKLRAEKQEHIINAALTVFGRSGYKKASVADIAEEAGISKSMVLYYFGSKKNLYLYLVALCGKTVEAELEKHFDHSVTDFFARLKVLTDIKIGVMKQHPDMISFFTNMFYETDAEVAGSIAEFIGNSENIRGKWMFEGMDVSKFKDDINPRLLEKFIIWAGIGCINDMPKSAASDEIDAFIDDFYRCFDWMKEYFYKA